LLTLMEKSETIAIFHGDNVIRADLQLSLSVSVLSTWPQSHPCLLPPGHYSLVFLQFSVMWLLSLLM
jgi:hypothetical protein